MIPIATAYEIINIAVSVTIGTIVGTYVVYKFAGVLVKRTMKSVLDDDHVSRSVAQFVEKSIVTPLNRTNNDDIKKLILDALEIALERMKKQ